MSDKIFHFYLVKRGNLRFIEFAGSNGSVRWEITDTQYESVRNIQDKFSSAYELLSYINMR